MRTGWVKTTIITKQRGDRELIKADEGQKHVAHVRLPDFLAQ